MNKVIAMAVRPRRKRKPNLFHILQNRSIGRPYKKDLESMKYFLWKKECIANMFRLFDPQIKAIHHLLNQEDINLEAITENLQYLEDEGSIDFLTFKQYYFPNLDLLPRQNEALQECIDHVDYIIWCRDMDEIEASGGCLVS